jgi:hypothetical protein
LVIGLTIVAARIALPVTAISALASLHSKRDVAAGAAIRAALTA